MIDRAMVDEGSWFATRAMISHTVVVQTPTYKSMKLGMKLKVTGCMVLTWPTIGIHLTRGPISSPLPNFEMKVCFAGGVGGEWTRCDRIAADKRSSTFSAEASII